ncbi:calcium-binding ef-hand protein [Grosmannia clavigera kw1407]|uniref:Calcium-binding ef-hand protein n=1 Tax=Grosmannia clavigera (strain kw1407 / UAMH 11150) TaxID=655863 RepID=F0XQA0_GROCL|nr:calcium-binding ef-hand protein [Grosmannia clavigera kw1407]EFX00067.1 calcium-binding ef-hand protein [Grosmannia clavigera kw1407]
MPAGLGCIADIDFLSDFLLPSAHCQRVYAVRRPARSSSVSCTVRSTAYFFSSRQTRFPVSSPARETMAMPAGYKPSPLGYGSPRSSPFRRPESPVSPTPLKGTPGGTATSPTGSWASRNQIPTSTSTPTPTQPAVSAPIGGSSSLFSSTPPASSWPAPASAMSQSTALSQLLPAQVRALREVFQILDRDSDGMVNREDVVDMLNQLGLPSKPADVSPFFPPASPQTIAMGSFLNSLAAALAAMSPSAELLSALSAFDEDDSGQVDLAELRDALLHTVPEPGERQLTEAEINQVVQGFTGRRAFTAKSKPGPSFGKRGEVFRYQDFVQSIAGGAPGNTAETEATREA